MEFVPILALSALVKKLVDFFKFLTNRDWNGAITMLVTWGAGIVALLVASQTDWADGINIGDKTLASLSFLSMVFVGMSVSSFGAVAGYDIPKSVGPTGQDKLPLVGTRLESKWKSDR